MPTVSTPAAVPTPTVQGRALNVRGRRTLARLLEAGAAVFAERGYHATRVDDVVARARTSHGNFYLYFSGKEDLFETLARTVADAMTALADEFPPLDPGPDGRRAVRTWLARFQALYAEHGALLRAWTEAEVSDSAVGRLGGSLAAAFTDRLATRIAPAAPDLDPRIAAVALVALVERSCYYAATGVTRADPDALLEAVAAAVHAGICGGIAPDPA